MEVFRSVAPQRGLQPCTTKGGAEEPRSGIFPKVKPRSSIDVMRADDLRSDCCAISTDDYLLVINNKIRCCHLNKMIFPF
jgi:hypothetical protein